MEEKELAAQEVKLHLNSHPENFHARPDDPWIKVECVWHCHMHTVHTQSVKL
jgi:hypothetical protein